MLGLSIFEYYQMEQVFFFISFRIFDITIGVGIKWDEKKSNHSASGTAFGLMYYKGL